FRVLLDVTLPIISPAIVAAWLLAFTLSLDDLIIASFVSGPGSTTLPMLIFSKVRLGVTPDVNALASIIMLLDVTGVVVAGWIMRRQERQRTRDLQAQLRAPS
ncbi:MAG: putrescine ABC transporter permease PotI, partial [Myxococcota bacterium]